MIATISVYYKKPEFTSKYKLNPDKISFVKIYHAVQKPDQDLAAIFREAFSQAHPDWPIMKVIVGPSREPHRSPCFSHERRFFVFQLRAHAGILGEN